VSVAALRRHPRVAHVAVEDGGDMVIITLKAPWSRYATGRADGYTRGFDVEEYDPNCDDNEAHLKAALNWVKNDVWKEVRK